MNDDPFPKKRLSTPLVVLLVLTATLAVPGMLAGYVQIFSKQEVAAIIR
jgi:hypothetical protein